MQVEIKSVFYIEFNQLYQKQILKKDIKPYKIKLKEGNNFKMRFRATGENCKISSWDIYCSFEKENPQPAQCPK